MRRLVTVRVPFALTIIAIIAVVCAGVLLALQHDDGPHLATYTAHGDFAKNGEYPTTYSLNVPGERWGSWGGADARTGTLQSSPFRAPVLLTLDVAGGTARSNEAIDVVGPDGVTTLSFKTPENAGEAFVPVTRLVPIGWWGRNVTLRVADDPGDGARSWVAIGDLHASTLVDVLLAPMIWFSNQEALYKVIALLLLAALVFSAARLPSERRPWTGRDTGFAAAVLLTFAWLRWPIDVVNGYLNIDEARTTAQGLRMAFHPVPWHGFDPATGGPLSIYVLGATMLFGRAPTFISTHIIGTVLVALTALFVFAAARTLWGSRIASCGTIVYVVVEAMTHDEDFVHTSSELLPNLILAAAVWSIAVIYRARAHPRLAGLALTAGTLIGAMPFAKLQSLPSAFVVWAAAIAILAATRRRAAVAAFVGGTFVVPIVLVGAATIVGAFHDFLISYLLANFAYASSGYLTGIGGNMAFLFVVAPRFGFALGGLIVLIASTAALCLLRRRKPIGDETSYVIFFAVLFAVTIYETFAPQRYFPHYLALQAVSASLLAAASAAVLASAIESPRWGRTVATSIVVAVAALLFVVPQIVLEAGDPEKYLHDVVANATYRGDAASARVSLYAAPRSLVAVWGWRPTLYVYSQTVAATRDGDTGFQLSGDRYLAYYRARYISDIEQHPPGLFIDAVAPSSFFYNQPATQGLETFPELNAFVRKEYTLTSEVDGVRFFVRRTHA